MQRPNPIRFLRARLAMAALLALSLPAHAWDAFELRDIRVEGLQRISLGTVLNYLPLKVGEKLDEERSSEALRALYKTGFFRDIGFERENGTLLIKVVERPSISGITISGNNDISTEDLLKGLKDIGLADGRIFNRSLLDQVEQELRQQYFSRGRYAVQVKSEVTDLERNRVQIAISIAEGKIATIQAIQLVGNEKFSDKELLKQFELAASDDVWLFSSRDQYARQKLAGDIERLRSFYLDRGHVNFEVESTQVSITPDRRDVYITVNLREGEPHAIREVRLAGDLVVGEEELRKLVTIAPGAIFSRKQVTEIAQKISERLGEEGFAFANVNPVPEVDAEQREVVLTFFVDPGKRVYVRRINMLGNTKTRDEVLRRELRQMEGGTMSPSRVNRSKTRIDRLGFFSDVQVATPAVPGAPDLVDINYSVTERPSGSLVASVGYSQTQGVVLSASVSQDNLFGSGNRVAFTINNSDVTRVYDFSHTNPYFTLDGVSRTTSVFLRETDASAANVANYVADVAGGSMSFGFPVSEFDRVSLSARYEDTKIQSGASPSTEIQNFISANGSEFAGFELGLGWSRDTRNRTIFADSGTLQSLSLETAIPGADLEFYKLRYRIQSYWPLAPAWSFSAEWQVAYGEGFGDTASFGAGDRLPFFENFYAGGVRTVRGYDGNSLGPRDSLGNPLGGNLLVAGSLELALPWMRDTNTTRWVLFADGANVYQTAGAGRYDADELRYSYGLGFTWMAPIGPLTFSLAQPFNDQPGDRLQKFQFTLGVAL